MTKTLKIVGIVFLVAVLLFGGTYFTIHVLNKKNENYEIFADAKVWDMDITGEKNITSNETVAYYLDQNSAHIQKALNLEYNYLKPYFATVGINNAQKKSLKALIGDVTEKTVIISDYVAQYDSKTNYKVPFYSALLPSYIEVANAELKLVKEMKNILVENGVQLNETLMFYFDLNNALVEIAINTTLKGAYLGIQTIEDTSFAFLKNELISGAGYSTIEDINSKIETFFGNPSSNEFTDVEILYNDFSYKMYLSAMTRYSNAVRTLNDNELLKHFKGLTVTEKDSNYENIKIANLTYKDLLTVLSNSTFELKICPFSSETAEPVLNLLTGAI